MSLVMGANASAERLLAAADFFQIAGMAFEYPTEELAAGLCVGALREDLSSCLTEMGCADDDQASSLAALGEAVSNQGPEEVLVRMRREHSRLFANPSRPLVWMYETMFCYEDDGSGKRPDLFVSPACLHVEQLMRQAGVRLSAGNRQPADYYPTELQFLSYLCNAAAHEPLAGDGEGLARERLAGFKRSHLDRWAIGFAELVSRETRLCEYRMIADLTSAALRALDVPGE